MGEIIRSEVKPTHRKRETVEAWLYTGQPQEQWPDWVRSHFINKGIAIRKSAKWRWAVRDDEGYFWRWFDADTFTERYEPKRESYWCQIPENRKALARDYIRRLADGPRAFRTEDGMANVALEGLWNVMHFDEEN